MKKSTVKVNTPISKKMKKIDDLIEEGVKEVFYQQFPSFMKEMISKELLSEVLGADNFRDIKKVENNITYTSFWNYDSRLAYEHINIYELTFLCKEWALEYPHILEVRLHADICTVNIEKDGNYVWIVQEDTEPEAIFKACEFILKELSNEKKN